MSDGMTALVWVFIKFVVVRAEGGTKAANTTITAERVGKKTKRNIAKTMTARLA